MRKILLIILCFLIVFTLTSCQENLEGFDEEKDRQISQLLREEKINEAKEKTRELYSGEEDKINKWIELIDEMYLSNKSNVITKDEQLLEIQEGWTWEKDGDYNYIRGRVKNIGDKNISYFEITAEYLNSADTVLDSDYTNSSQTLMPNNMKEFEIMHKHDDNYSKVRIFVNEVRVE